MLILGWGDFVISSAANSFTDSKLSKYKISNYFSIEDLPLPQISKSKNRAISNRVMPVKTHKYSNKDITIIWKPEVCIHSKICWQGLREVFDPARRPWILPEGASTEKIKAQVDKCPSGALSYIAHTPDETASSAMVSPNAQIIECMPNGPLLVKGAVTIKKSDGTEETKTGTVALCRCGQSNNKPYCDGGHLNAGFQG